MKKLNKYLHAFTLVEFIIIMVILGVLVSIVTLKLGYTGDETRLAALRETLQTTRTQLGIAALEHYGVFPNLLGGEDKWDALTKESKPIATTDNEYTIIENDDLDLYTSGSLVGPYLHSTPYNEFEDSNVVQEIGSAASNIGFVYNQSTGRIKAVISTDKFEYFKLDTDDFESY